MIQLNTDTKLPSAVRPYVFLKLSLILLAISIPLGTILKSASSILGIFGLLWLLILPALVIALLTLNSIVFNVNENNITIKSGIFFKHSSSIPYSNIQNIDSASGPLRSLLHLCRLNIWTSSSAQVVIRNGRSENEPIGLLLLTREDADWLKNFILSKQTVSPTTSFK